MDGRGRRSYKMFQTQFLPPSSFLLLLLPTAPLPAPPIFLFFYFSQSPDISLFPPLSTLLGQWKHPISLFLPLSFHLFFFSPLFFFFFFLFRAQLWTLPPRWQHSFGYAEPLKKMSQLIRKPDTLKRLQCFNYSKGVNYWPLNGFLFLTLRYSYRNVSNTASRPEYKLTNVRNVLFFFCWKLLIGFPRGTGWLLLLDFNSQSWIP